MAIATKTATRKPRKKKAEEPQASTIALPALADEHLDVPTLETWLWDAACAIRGAADAPKFKDFILPLVFFKRLSDVFDDEFAAQIVEFGDEDVAREVIRADHEDALKNNRKPIVRFFVPHEYRWDAIRNHAADGTLGQFVTDAMREVAKLNPELLGVLDIKDYNERQSGQRTLDDDRLSALIEVVSRHRLGLKNAEPDILGRAYEYLLRKFAEGQGQSAGEFYTPKEVGWLMAHLLDPNPYTTVYDPTCGSAGLLIKARLLFEQKNPQHKSKAPRLYGQEMNPVTFAMAKMNMFLHDYTDSLFAIGDTFKNPGFASESAGLRRFDYVVANPMWNDDNYDESLYENDRWKRFEAGAAPASSADWGWLQHIAASLNDAGRAAVVLDTGAVSRGSGNKSSHKERTARQAFVEADLVEAVILLPENLFYNTSAPGIVAILNRNKSAERRRQFLLVNAYLQFIKDKPKNVLSKDGIGLISEVFHGWKTTERFSTVVSLERVREADYDLSPSFYVNVFEAAKSRPLTQFVEDLCVIRDEQQRADAGISEAVQALRAGATNFDRGRESSTVPARPPTHWQLRKLDDVLLKKQYGLSVRGGADYGVPLLRMNNLVNGRIDVTDLQRAEVDEKTLPDYRLERGDLLFNRTNSADLVGKTSLFDLDGIYTFASYLIRLRVDESIILPAFLNAFLNCRSTLRRIRMLATRGVSQANISGSKLGRFMIPVPPLAEQREIARVWEAFAGKLDTVWREAQFFTEFFDRALEQVMLDGTKE